MPASGLPKESTFHDGEVAVQREAGVADRLGRLGPQVIRDHMPEQHRDFFASLPFVIVGSIDEQGQPSASLLAGPPGFVSSATPSLLRIDALPMAGDPLDLNLRAGAAVGLLGIQPHTRRRNRANGRILERDEDGLTLAVEQSFGNCPKYIHARELVYRAPSSPVSVRVSSALDADSLACITEADTFFLASAHPDAGSSTERSHGVDVSHRGGPPGFLHFTAADTFIMPDFRGNNFYNTLGNLRLHSAAGLLFIDFARGDVLQLSASAEAVSGSHPRAGAEATGRIVRFVVHEVRYYRGASPLRVVAGD
jgi:predicted pyridoxine 5'-phosphate oxidase superfamily flavin-nucleotide-binding protein